MLIELNQSILYLFNFEIFTKFHFFYWICIAMVLRRKWKEKKSDLYRVIKHKSTKGAISLISMQVVSLISTGVYTYILVSKFTQQWIEIISNGVETKRKKRIAKFLFVFYLLWLFGGESVKVTACTF